MTTTFQTAPTLSLDVKGTEFVYRWIGESAGIPIVFLHHLTAVLDDWDPRVVDGIAEQYPVIVFDNRGVGGSAGITPTNVEAMADDAVAFIRALGLEQVDLLGFSLGGFVVQAILQRHSDLVRKAILAGTGPAGVADLTGLGNLLKDAYSRASATGKHPKHFLFFTPSVEGQKAAENFLTRLNERTENRDTPVTEATIDAQLTAISTWGRGDPSGLASVSKPILVANGDHDVMVPTFGSFELLRILPNAQLSIFSDAGHGGIFQYHSIFVSQALAFLHQSVDTNTWR